MEKAVVQLVYKFDEKSYCECYIMGNCFKFPTNLIEFMEELLLIQLPTVYNLLICYIITYVPLPFHLLEV